MRWVWAAAVHLCLSWSVPPHPPVVAMLLPPAEVLVKKSINCSTQKHLPRSLCFFIINEKHYQWNVKQERYNFWVQ